MSLAWTTVAVLVLLLPGFLFFVGLQAEERFSQDAGATPVIQLAGIVLISFLVHGTLYAVLGTVCGGWLPCIDLKPLVAVLQLDQAAGAGGVDRVDIERNLRDFRWWIWAYVLGTSLFALGSGWLWSRMIVAGWPGWLRAVGLQRAGEQLQQLGIKLFWKHRWAYNLVTGIRDDNPLLAHVLTQIRQDHRVLIYRGLLKEFFVRPDGQMSYLALKAASWHYLPLEDLSARTIDRDQCSGINAGSRAADDRRLLEAGGDAEGGYLVIPGSEIANVLFERLRITEESMDAFLRTFRGGKSGSPGDAAV